MKKNEEKWDDYLPKYEYNDLIVNLPDDPDKGENHEIDFIVPTDSQIHIGDWIFVPFLDKHNHKTAGEVIGIYSHELVIKPLFKNQSSTNLSYSVVQKCYKDNIIEIYNSPEDYKRHRLRLW